MNDGVIFSSESKASIALVDRVHQFPPGSTWSSAAPLQFEKWWNLQNVMYSERDTVGANDDNKGLLIRSEEEALRIIHDDLVEATKKRLMSGMFAMEREWSGVE